MCYTEQRFNHRHAVDFTTYIMWDGRLIEATARNISPQGMLLECKGLSCPMALDITICCIVARVYYEMAGTIAHIRNGKIGISFKRPQSGFYQSALRRGEKSGALMTRDLLPAQQTPNNGPYSVQSA